MNVTLKISHKISLLFLICFLVGCEKEQENVPQPESRTEIVDRTVLVYIAANNDLGNEAINSIKKLQIGAKNLKGNLLVFVKTNALNSYLLKINHWEEDMIVSDTLKTYSTENTSDASFLAGVIKDAREISPATTYGLVLWSHGTSWAPPTNRVSPMSFGWDDGKEMDILDLKNVLPDDFEFIMFDACSMASLEVIYELKGKAKYILASPAEVLSTGFPYDKLTQYLFGNVSSLKFAAELFIEHYRNLPGFAASATVSLIDMQHLDIVASRTKELMNTIPQNFKLDPERVQRLDFDDAPVAGFDFLDFIEKHFDERDKNDIKDILEDAVIFKAHTEKFLGKPIKTFSGLTIYIPEQDDQYKEYYSTLSWYNAGGWHNIFNLSRN